MDYLDMEQHEYVPEAARLKENLRMVVKVYSAHLGLKESSALMRVLGSQQPRMIYLDDEAGIRADRYDGWVQTFSDNWPDDLEWPVGIARPPVGLGGEKPAE